VRFVRQLIANFDWGTLLFTLAITALSVAVLYSATYDRSESLGGLYLRQLSWVGFGVVAMCAALCLDYQTLCRYTYVFYGVALAGLVAVLLFGRVINGAQRWLVFGPWRLQTSELIKPALILILARYFCEEKRQEDALLTFHDLLVPVVLVTMPFLLVVKQPDLSTAMVLLAIAGTMIGVVGLQRRVVVLGVVLGASAIPVMWHMLAEYQRNRLLTLFNPQSDLLGTGYQSWQSKIAIGSGGLWGKGFRAGTQSHLNFLPEKHTDFIFAVLGEELGFMGALLLIVLFSGLLLRGFLIAYRARDRLGVLIATGVVTLLSVQVFLNIGMTIGILPIIGLPLPLMSYGGSSLVTTFFCLGLLMNVRMRRFKF
jgi:rod shape determining protein RodA